MIYSLYPLLKVVSGISLHPVYVPSKMDPSLAPENSEALYVLVPVPELSKFNDWSPTTLKNYRQLIINKLRQTATFSDIEQHIVVEK
ncbi:squalene synthase [Lactiplantibacillus plantarum]|nr:squalene synthase [Lactiplantibacillus plantarum]